MLQLHTLGAGGYIPNDNRETTSFLIVNGSEAILLDLGTGVSHLLKPYYLDILASVSKLSILVSHYHLDHLVGLTWLPKFCRVKTEIFAPAPPLLEGDMTALTDLTAPMFFSLPIDRFPFELTITPLTDLAITVANLPVKLIPQTHAGGSVGYRFGDSIAYITDTDPTDNAVLDEFVRGVHTIVTDTMYDKEHYERLAATATKPLDHGFSEGAAKFASRASAESLILMHISPDYSEARVDGLLQEARKFFAGTILGDDCTCLDIP